MKKTNSKKIRVKVLSTKALPKAISPLLEIPIKYEMIYDKIYKRNGLNVRKHPFLAVKSTWPTSST